MTDSNKNPGKVALITGGAQGIGFAIARELALDGRRVVIADLSEDKAVSAAGQIAQQANIQTLGLKIDVSDGDSIRQGVEQVNERMDAVEILVNNAGIYKSTPIFEVRPEVWKLLLDVMLTGPLLMSQAVLSGMIDANWGRIINLGSLSSVMGFGEDVAYCAAKSGIAGMTRSLAAELAGYQICVNTICPGNVLTDLMRETGVAIEKRDGLDPGQFLRDQTADIPLGRLGQPADIAHLAAFLCSDKAAYITGQAIHVNGGLYQT